MPDTTLIVPSRASSQETELTRAGAIALMAGGLLGVSTYSEPKSRTQPTKDVLVFGAKMSIAPINVRHRGLDGSSCNDEQCPPRGHDFPSHGERGASTTRRLSPMSPAKDGTDDAASGQNA